MNTGLTISFIIGGLLLISVLALNASVIQNSGETTLNMTAKQTVETVTQIMSRDFLRMGYNVDEDEDAIEKAFATKIEFKADMNNNSTADPATITWELTNEEVTNTPNEDDYYLKRTIGSEAPQKFAVTKFQFTFFNGDGNTTNNNTEVTSIRVSMESQAGSKYGNKNNYETSIWNKTFTPPNLNFGAYNSN